ncbi:hypothetical protein [Jeotgalibaca porci]|uniref:hypothetical protein n=1 Tax=Jeotgalibaca porci TaxID=1868793 RepID=UPI0035A02DA1
MTREEKIELLIKRLGDRFTRKHLDSKSDRFIDALYQIESEREDREADALVCSF